MKLFTRMITIFLLIFSILSTSYAKEPYYYKYYKWEKDLVNYKKAIVVDTNSWTLSAYFHWEKIWLFPASVWNKSWPTPKWKFKIVAKLSEAKSATNWLIMPYWMEFYWKWKYWIHAMPLYPDRKPKYSQDFVYKKLWWWCVRLKDEDIKILYNWTEVNTTIIII